MTKHDSVGGFFKNGHFRRDVIKQWPPSLASEELHIAMGYEDHLWLGGGNRVALSLSNKAGYGEILELRDAA